MYILYTWKNWLVEVIFIMSNMRHLYYLYTMAMAMDITLLLYVYSQAMDLIND